MKVVLAFLLFTSLCCSAQNNVSSNSVYNKFYEQLRKQFFKIDSLQQNHDPGYYDSLGTVNEKIIEILKEYQNAVFQFPDSLDYDLIYLVKSNDRSLVLISWDTRMGGTMIDFTTMAVFKSPQGIRAEMLTDSSGEQSNSSDTYMHFNSIATVRTSAGKKIYLARGYGQGSSALPWQELRAFSIENNKLVQPGIFPGKETSLFVEFDLHAFGENQEVPSIRIKHHGSLIEVPENCKNEGFCGKYKTYVFNGKNFQVKRVAK